MDRPGGARGEGAAAGIDPGPALVLSGGGMRGAYEVGVVRGIADVLGLGASGPAPFRAFSGTSVGAINAASFASRVDRGDMGVDDAIARWTALSLRDFLRPDLGALCGRPRREPPGELAAAGPRGGRALLDVRPLERLVLEAVDWDALHDHVRAGRVSALVIAALEVRTGRTWVAAEVARGVRFVPSPDPTRTATTTRIGPPHVLGSAALPMLYPARLVEGRWTYDGGLRFNTPISPVLRMGARKLCVVSVRHRGTSDQGPRDPREVSTAFLAGKLLDAVLLDPMSHDLQVLERTNRLVACLDRCMAPEARAAFDRMVREMRGRAWRTVDLLVFTPSRDVGAMAARRVDALLRRGRVPPVPRLALHFFRRAAAAREADLASFLLFDGGFAEELVALGRRDALARADEVRRFFGA